MRPVASSNEEPKVIPSTNPDTDTQCLSFHEWCGRRDAHLSRRPDSCFANCGLLVESCSFTERRVLLAPLLTERRVSWVRRSTFFSLVVVLFHMSRIESRARLRTEAEPPSILLQPQPKGAQPLSHALTSD